MVIEHPTSTMPDAAGGQHLPGARSRRRGQLPRPEGTAVIEGLGHIRLEVQDVARAVAFYRDGLRFGSLDAGDDAGQGVHFQAGRLHVVLVPRPNGRSPQAPAAGHGVRLTLDVAGLEAYHDALVARGLVPSAPGTDADLRSFVVVDPDGYEWCFRQSLH